MSIDRRNCTNSDPQVTKRLFTILVLMIGLICIFGGYLLGRMARSDVKRSTDLLTFNLTIVADNLYKKAKNLSPKAIHHYDAEKIRVKLASIFDCTHVSCATLDKNHLSDFIKKSVNLQVLKLIKSVHNATAFLNDLT